MSQRLIDHVWIFLTVIFAIYSQLTMKWQVTLAGPLPVQAGEKFVALLHLIVQPWILSALFATFLSGLCWMVTLTKFELSYAFPFTAMNFLIMFAAGALLFGEQVTLGKLGGTVLVAVGVLFIVTSGVERT